MNEPIFPGAGAAVHGGGSDRPAGNSSEAAALRQREACLGLCGGYDARVMSSSLCRLCDSRPATVHYTEIKEGVATVLDLCEECATKQGMTNPIPSLLSGLLEGAKGVLAAASTSSDLKCPDCGMKFDEFRARGRLGCPRDYEVFAKELVPLLEKIHGSTQHVGRVPLGQGPDTLREDRLLRLRRDLARAVKGEDYEAAARLRDEIHGAETGLRGPR